MQRASYLQRRLLLLCQIHRINKTQSEGEKLQAPILRSNPSCIALATRRLPI